MTKRLFYITQTVICINDDFRWARSHYPDPNIIYPVFGLRYIIRTYVCGGKFPAVALFEIKNKCVIYQDGIVREAGFWDRRFVSAPPPVEAEAEKEKEIAC